MDTPHISGRTLIGVVDLLSTRAHRGEETTLPAALGDNLTVVFALTGTTSDLAGTRRPFAWFIRQNASVIADRLEVARNATRSDRQGRDVDLSDLPTDERWPVLQLSVRAA